MNRQCPDELPTGRHDFTNFRASYTDENGFEHEIVIPKGKLSVSSQYRIATFSLGLVLSTHQPMDITMTDTARPEVEGSNVGTG